MDPELIHGDLVNDKWVLERTFRCLLDFFEHLLILVLRHPECNLLDRLIVWHPSRLQRLFRGLSHDLSCHFLGLESVLSDNELLAFDLLFHDD